MSSSSDFDSLWARSSSPRSDRSSESSELHNHDDEDGICQDCQTDSKYSSRDDFPWILYHLLDCEPPVALPVRTMFAFNSGYKLPSVKEAHQWWGRNGKGGKLIEFVTSLEDRRLTPREIEQRNLQLANFPPKDPFSDRVNQKLYALPVKECPESMRRPEKHTVPLKTAESFSHMFFTEDYTQSISTMGLTAIDYFQDYEWMRRGRLQAAAARLGITRENWRQVLAEDKLALQWLQIIEKYELEIEVLFASSYIDMRIWVMAKHLQDESFYKPESMAYLNSLFPPCDQDIASSYNLPNALIDPKTLAKHRSCFFKYICSVEKCGAVVMDNFVNQLLCAGTKHSWPDTRANLTNYFSQATSMIEMADAVTGLEFWRQRSETELSPHPEDIFARWSLEDQVRQKEDLQRTASSSEHGPTATITATKNNQPQEKDTQPNKILEERITSPKSISASFWKFVRRGKSTGTAATMESAKHSELGGPVSTKAEEATVEIESCDKADPLATKKAEAMRAREMAKIRRERIARKASIHATRVARDVRRAQGKKIMSRLEAQKELIKTLDPTAKHWLKDNITWKRHPKDGVHRPTIRVPKKIKVILQAFEETNSPQALEERLGAVSPVEPRLWAESNPIAEEIKRQMERRERRGRASYLWEPKNCPGDRPSDESSSESETENQTTGKKSANAKSDAENNSGEKGIGKPSSEGSEDGAESGEYETVSEESGSEEEIGGEKHRGEQPGEVQSGEEESGGDASDSESVDMETAQNAARKIGKYLSLDPESSPTTPTTPSAPFGLRKMHSTARVIKLAESALTYVLEEDEAAQPALPENAETEAQGSRSGISSATEFLTQTGTIEEQIMKNTHSFGRLALKIKSTLKANIIKETFAERPTILRKQKSLPAIMTSKSTSDLHLAAIPNISNVLKMAEHVSGFKETMENSDIQPKRRQGEIIKSNFQFKAADQSSTALTLTSNTSNEGFVLGSPPTPAAQKAKKLHKAESSRSLVSIPESTKSSASIETIIHRPATPSKSLLSPWVNRMRRAKSDQALSYSEDVVITGDDIHDPMPPLTNLQAYTAKAGTSSTAGLSPKISSSKLFARKEKDNEKEKDKDKQKKEKNVEAPTEQPPRTPSYPKGYPAETMANATSEEEKYEIVRRYLIDKSKRERAEQEAEEGRPS